MLVADHAGPESGIPEAVPAADFSATWPGIQRGVR